MNTLVKVTLAEQAHRELRARIVSGKLRGGERLLPNELAADLGISPTPVKEACVKLEADGLVVNSSRRGMVVRDFTVEDVEELYAARMLLEKGAVEVAFDAGQLDGALHTQLLESLANIANSPKARHWMNCRKRFLRSQLPYDPCVGRAHSRHFRLARAHSRPDPHSFRLDPR